MKEKQSVDALLTLERDISGRIHSAITEILRKGYDNNGKEQIRQTAEFIRYKLEDMEYLFEKRG